MNDADELSSIRVKREAEDRFLKQLDFGARIGRVLYLVIGMIVAAALWCSALQYQVKDNRRDIKRNYDTIKIIWEKIFGYPMPP